MEVPSSGTILFLLFGYFLVIYYLCKEILDPPRSSSSVPVIIISSALPPYSPSVDNKEQIP
jgi:hypothetical protein